MLRKLITDTSFKFITAFHKLIPDEYSSMATRTKTLITMTPTARDAMLYRNTHSHTCRLHFFPLED